jgi:hypothetical protein
LHPTQHQGLVINAKALSIVSFNVILKRELLDLASLSGATLFIRDHVESFPGVDSVTANGDLIAVRFASASELEEFVKMLVRSGLELTSNGSFEDFAIVHGTHGFAMPCDWLEFHREDEGGIVWPIQYEMQPESVLPDIHEPAEEMSWITGLGHGFMVSREDDHEVWLDFTTGRTVIELRPTVTQPPLTPVH